MNKGSEFYIGSDLILKVIDKFDGTDLWPKIHNSLKEKYSIIPSDISDEIDLCESNMNTNKDEKCKCKTKIFFSNYLFKRF